ncbi:GGDEF domain-containing protein [Kineothrix sedimenti]|uniref:GGDEF domain-containing protein n=1 Tax=Kineothrix sedimenti TaxID=3123317 RepID=A0ABZ3ET30_9FIRM
MKKFVKIWKRLFIGIFLCSVLVGILLFYVNILEKELNDEIIGVLKETSEQSVVILNKEVEGEFILLEEVSDRLSVRNGFNPEEAVAELEKVAKRYSVKRMGIIMPDGQAYTTDKKNLNLGDREFFMDSLRGKRGISGRLQDKDNGEDIVVFSMPIYEDGSVCAVVFTTHRIAEIQNLFTVSIFDGKGYSYIIEENGDIVMNTTNSTGFKGYDNIYEALGAASGSNAEAVDEMHADLENQERGYIRFHNKIDKYMYYSPLQIKNWYVLNVVPSGVMDSTRDFIMLLTYALCGVLGAIFASFILYIIKTEQKKKKELSNILYVDNVTGGYSFARFSAEAKKRLKEADTNTAYIVMDVDQFKIINELFGYEEGNETLRYIWQMCRRYSKENEIYARRIADKFVALWYFDSREELDGRIKGFLEALQKNYPDTINDYILKVSFGIYIVKDKTEDIQHMMNYATMAHSSIKGQDDVQYAFYDDDFRQRMLQEKLLEDQMKLALQHEEFIVYYQPKYSVTTKKLVGAEALVRWRKADGSTVMPGKFIPLAEKKGFISYLDKYIFAEVCKKQKEWLEAGKEVVPVSVNLSRRHLYNDSFIEEYVQMVEDAKVPAKYMQLELTESAIFENQEALCQIIDRLHAMGFRILMDDFGTGYSSLMMLKSISIDVLKLDKSFVDDFDDPKGQKIITSVIELAQALHMEVTAEGVETEEQYEFLRKLGCNTIQGFYFAKPMPEEEFERLLN